MKPLYKEKISNEEIDQLPLCQYEGEIHVIDDKEIDEAMLTPFRTSDIIGFDTETKPSFIKGIRNRVALLQLSTENSVLLIRTLKAGLPDSIIQLLENPSIKKIGVAIKDDISSLQKIKRFTPHGFIDLQQFSKEFGIEDNGLKKLAANILQVKISKSQRLTNWENNHFSEAQIRYAATDAWICYRMYKQLISQ